MKLKPLLSTLCGVLAALALFGIMGLTLVDVSGRKLLDTSVTGSLEVTELLLVVVIFAGLPLVSLAGEHVVFDSLDPLLPPWFRRAQQIVVDALCAAALLGVAWLMWSGLQLRRGDKLTTGTTCPVYPANPGDRIVADFGRFGRVEVHFTRP